DVVAALIDRFTFDDGYIEDVRAVTKRIKEQDVFPLHVVRLVCELAGLLRRRSQRFEVTTAGRRLAASDRAGELHATLFHTFFRKLSLDYLVGWGEWPELQHQVAFTLYRLPEAARDWSSAGDLLSETVLPYAL